MVRRPQFGVAGPAVGSADPEQGRRVGGERSGAASPGALSLLVQRLQQRVEVDDDGGARAGARRQAGLVFLALAFIFTVAGALGAAIWGSDATGARIREVAAALLPTETLLLGAAVVWYFAGQ